MTSEPTVTVTDPATGQQQQMVLRTKTGRILTETDLEALADEAEHTDYDPATFTERSRRDV